MRNACWGVCTLRIRQRVAEQLPLDAVLLEILCLDEIVVKRMSPWVKKIPWRKS